MNLLFPFLKADNVILLSLVAKLNLQKKKLYEIALTENCVSQRVPVLHLLSSK